MPLNLLGKKKGMTRLFDKKGDSIVCTVIEVEPHAIVQLKTKEKDGYAAVQVGAVKLSENRAKKKSKALKGHFAKAKVEPHRYLRESPSAEGEEYTVGDEVTVEQFAEVKKVDVTGTSKGKGFQGAMKRHNFKGGPAAHGSGFHRALGSTGMCSDPGRTMPGKKMPGRMGGERVTVEGLNVLKVDAEKRIIIVKGAIPGAQGEMVSVRKSVKKS